MFDRNSDYALNKKDPDAIVCKSATGIHIRLTRADFSSAEEFEKWKRWSDENYHAIEKADHRHSNRTISLEGLAELSFAVLSAETEVMNQYDQEERARLCRLLAEGLDACLTAPQRRVGRPAHGNGGRFIAYGAVATRRWLVYLYYCLNGHAE